MRHALVCVCLFVVSIACLAPSHGHAADTGKLRVATFRGDVTPPLGFPSYPSNKPLETVETPLLAKGIVLDDGRQRVVLCAVDWCGLCASAHDLFRSKIAAAAETDVSNVAVHTVHQHTAPYIPTGSLEVRDRAGNPPNEVDPLVLSQIAERLADSVKESLARFQPFNAVGTGQAKVDRVASARRILTAEGKIRTRWSACTDPDLRAEPEGRIDPVLKTLTLAQDDKPLVRIHYYATHPQSFYGDPRTSYDVPGYARERLEEKEDVFQIYFTGCAGDVVMGKYNDRTPEARAELIDRLHAGMEASVASTQMTPVNGFTWRTVPVALPLKDEPGYDVAKNRALMEDVQTPDKEWMQAARRVALAEWMEQPIELGLLRIGPADLVHLPGESVIEFQLFTQAQHPNRFTAVAAYGDLATGYICEEADFAEGGYEPSASHVAPESEGIFKEAIRKLLQ
ncbi:MAG: hypothetical protein RBS80_20770 [Thermoguttaceae bacterium]|jgi:hypothetical protein|nr:hypothetical protein [Thermoguttaceae bacterium]